MLGSSEPVEARRVSSVRFVGETPTTDTIRRQSVLGIIAERIDVSEPYRMVSALGEQASVELWNYTIDAEGTHWFWPASHPEPGAMVHCGSPVFAGKRSDGFGGATLTFNTADGPIPIQGPWHSNTNALFERTGVDLRDKHLTYGVIGTGRESTPTHNTVITGVVHADPKEGVLGTFDRIKEKAQQLANEHEQPFYYYSKSRGGSSCGPVYPSKWTPTQIRQFHHPLLT